MCWKPQPVREIGLGPEVSAQTLIKGWQAALMQVSTANHRGHLSGSGSFKLFHPGLFHAFPGFTTAPQSLIHSRVKGKNMEMCLLSVCLLAPPKPFCMHPLPSCHTSPPVFVSQASFLPERSPITAPKPLTGVSCIQLTDSPKPLQK